MKKDGFLIIKVVVTENGMDELNVIMKIRARRLMILVLCCIVDYLAILGLFAYVGHYERALLAEIAGVFRKSGGALQDEKNKESSNIKKVEN